MYILEPRKLHCGRLLPLQAFVWLMRGRHIARNCVQIPDDSIFKCPPKRPASSKPLNDNQPHLTYTIVEGVFTIYIPCRVFLLHYPIVIENKGLKITRVRKPPKLASYGDIIIIPPPTPLAGPRYGGPGPRRM